MVGAFPNYGNASSQQLLARTLFSQQVEAKIGCNVLTQPTKQPVQRKRSCSSCVEHFTQDCEDWGACPAGRGLTGGDGSVCPG
jgi:hypothetical protein